MTMDANVDGRTGMLTDHYELTMVEAALVSGLARRRAVFEVFARELPGGRRYGVVAGTDRVVDAILGFGFSEGEIEWLMDRGVVSERTAQWLASYRFSGSVDGYLEGELYFPGSPVLSIEAPFAQVVVLETVVLSILNHDSAVATTASRMRTAAGDRILIEMGSRRTHEVAAIAAARAAYLAGFDFSSNLAAGYHYAVPTTGTAAHAFTLAHRTEEEAFEAQVAALGVQTTLLVDTYDVISGVENAVGVAGGRLGAIRIDSGDLTELSRRARLELDRLGAPETRIVLSGDLDEHKIAAILDAGAPADAFGVGTRLVSGLGNPSPGFVYKLVAIATSDDPDSHLRPVAKACGSKATLGGRKSAFRRIGPDGHALAEVIVVGDGPEPQSSRPLQVRLVQDGERCPDAMGDPRSRLVQARARYEHCIKELDDEALGLDPGPPAIPTELIRSSAAGGSDRARAIVVVDVQNDFCEGGSLAVGGGAAIARSIAEYLQTHRNDYSAIAFTKDWHIDPGEHFASSTGAEPNFSTTWPDHCIAGTIGAEIHPQLIAELQGATEFRKGLHEAAYSGFEGRSEGQGLGEWLTEREIKQLDVVGLATDYCVFATAMDAARLGFETRVLLGMCAGVAEHTTQRACKEMELAGITLVQDPLHSAKS